MDNRTEFQFDVNKHACVCTCVPLFSLNTPVSGGPYAIAVTVSLLNILTAITGIVLNALVLIAYQRNRRLQILSNISLMALAFIDLLVCVLVLPFFSAKKIAEIYTVFNCFLWATHRVTVLCGFSVSLGMLAFISVERFLTLAFPFRSQVMVTQERLKISLGLFFVTVCLLSTVQLLRRNNINYLTSIIYMAGCLITIFSTWIWIHRLTAQHKRQIVSLNTPSNFARNAQNTRTCYWMVASSMICFFPELVLVVLHNIISTENWQDVWVGFIAPFANLLMNINSLINPTILLYRKREFRQTVKQIIF